MATVMATATAATANASGGGRVWYRLAVLYFVVATALGLFMGVSEDHGLFPVHAHLNLLGWVSLALTGVLYERFPDAIGTRLYPLHFWVYNITLPVSMVMLALAIKGNAAVGPALGVVSILLFASIVVFAINIWRNS
jgi:hypothetical protein